MSIKENKYWIIIAAFCIIDFSIVTFIFTFIQFTNFTDWRLIGLLFSISALPFLILTIWIFKKIDFFNYLRRDRNWLILSFYFYSIFLILYIINVFGPAGLIFWEIAFVLIIPCLVSVIWSIRRLWGMKKNIRPIYKKEIIIFCLIINIGFSIFAILPAASVFTQGQQFEEKFKSKLGDNYWEEIPKEYRERLKSPGHFFDTVDLVYFFNKEVEVETIEYGKDEYQIFDKYEDSNIKEKNKPALIYIHGGGSLESEAGGAGKWVCTYFASIGFVSFSIEYTPAPIEPFPKGLTDVMKAIVYIKEHAGKYGIDNDSIALFGQSRGGQLVTLIPYIGTNNNDWWRGHGANYTESQLEVACVVDMYGVVDQFYGAEHNQVMGTRNEMVYDGTPEEEKKVYEEHTVKNFVSKDVPPTLIMHGTIDGIVNVGESRGLVKELEKASANYIYLEYYLGQHGFDEVPGTPGSDLTYYFAPRFILAVLFGNGFK